jgi:transcriptional regulator with XRE-family HTH domain
MEASLESRAHIDVRRGASRRKLHLDVGGTTGSGIAANVIILNISETGVLLRTSAALSIGERLEVALPQVGTRAALVMWASGDLFGCQFEEPISRAAVSAAQLRGKPEAAGTARDAPSAFSGPDEGDDSFGGRLKRLRQQRRITMAGLARKAGVSKPTLWKWERNDVRPRTKSIGPLAAALGVSETELLFGGAEAGRDTASAHPQAPDRSSILTNGILKNFKDEISCLAGVASDKVSILIQY